MVLFRNFIARLFLQTGFISVLPSKLLPSPDMFILEQSQVFNRNFAKCETFKWERLGINLSMPFIQDNPAGGTVFNQPMDGCLPIFLPVIVIMGAGKMRIAQPFRITSV